jgi:hypothetical protein
MIALILNENKNFSRLQQPYKKPTLTNMRIKFIFLFFFTLLSTAQEKNTFGKLTSKDLAFTTYEKDTTANAVILYEKGDNYFEVINYRIYIVKKYHAKIKILNDKAFNKGNISIPYYHNKDYSEEIKELKAITHNGNFKTNLLSDQIFNVDINQNYQEKKFTFPNIKAGSILEYQYEFVTPFVYNFKGWDFQDDIPKIYSEFNAKIPANYNYNRSLVGTLKLNVNDATVKKNCFYVPGYSDPADCEILKYSMKNIPAFKDEEDYMLAPSNYKSRINFELAIYYGLDGTTNNYTKSWKDVDKEFKTDKDIGRQLKKVDFFEKNVPKTLFSGEDELEKAKNIFSFVKDHYTWNEKYGIYKNIRVKEAFNNKIGSVCEVNISLINLLNAGGIKTNLMLLSTRNNGLPKKIHPVISDFNYLIAKAEINGKTYLLDATDKHIPFGMLPFRCLNSYGRVMDFKKESYWQDISVDQTSRKYITTEINFNLKENNLNGSFKEINSGYEAVSKHKKISTLTEENYLNELEEKSISDYTINSYSLNEEETNEAKTVEDFEFTIDNIATDDIIYLNPFLIKFFSKNPFILNERNYPIDFGYNKNYFYMAKINIPEGYEIQEIPKNKLVALDNNLGSLRFSCMSNKNQVLLSFSLILNSSHFPSGYYIPLKKLFNQVVEIQNNSLMVLKKI